jgi:hypothetical protein
MPPVEEPPMEEQVQELPAQSLYSADKAQIMEAMNLIHQALMLLLEVCPPEEYDEGGEEMPMEEEVPMEEDGPPEA